MTPTEFIKERLFSLIETFNTIKIRYENDFISNAHFVEITPQYVYDSNVELKKIETETILDFISLYPDQNLCFISEDALVGLNSVDFEITGSLYDVFYSFNKHSYNLIQLDELKQLHNIDGFKGKINFGRPNKVINGIKSKVNNTETLNQYYSIVTAKTMEPTEVSDDCNYATAA